MRRFVVISCCLFVFVGLWSSSLLAAQKDFAWYLKEARQAYSEGRRLSSQGKHKGAIIQYKKALSWLRKAKPVVKEPKRRTALLHSESVFRYIIAEAYQRSGDCEAALSYTRLILQGIARKGIKPLVRKLQSRAMQMAACQPSPVQLTTRPDGANIELTLLQQKISGKTPWSGKLSPGRWKLRISHPLYQTHQREISVSGQKVFAVHIDLGLPLSSPPDQGRAPAPLWSKILVLGLSSAVIIGGIAAMSWAGVEYGTIGQLQGQVIEGIPEAETYNHLKPRLDNGNTSMVAGGLMFAVGAATAIGYSTWLLLQKPTREPQAPTPSGPKVLLPSTTPP